MDIIGEIPRAAQVPRSKAAEFRKPGLVVMDSTSGELRMPQDNYAGLEKAYALAPIERRKDRAHWALGRKPPGDPSSHHGKIVSTPAPRGKNFSGSSAMKVCAEH
jgi:hypothetical protein